MKNTVKLGLGTLVLFVSQVAFAATATTIECHSELKNGAEWGVSVEVPASKSTAAEVQIGLTLGGHATFIDALIIGRAKRHQDGFTITGTDGSSFSVTGSKGHVLAKTDGGGDLALVNEDLVCESLASSETAEN